MKINVDAFLPGIHKILEDAYRICGWEHVPLLIGQLPLMRYISGELKVISCSSGAACDPVMCAVPVIRGCVEPAITISYFCLDLPVAVTERAKRAEVLPQVALLRSRL